ncbi:hypothetical protein BCR35DRAFT_306246 [Leucosporidium creatinivorum]|uniref:MutL C-terminal dimerisation domain-containing protein n=1 Tax=Leucosporidium creatinivorum TaxID=106004 RepID=A0A1Y2EVX0_9BASI|nr:hypothetical protein BCR35DRAFT_306246 [Leucosporidium creatinivorum]
MSAPSPGEPPPAATARPIAPLPATTTSLLRSTLVIPSLPAALIELVQNALDAQSSRIDVTVDLDRWTIKCEDNGLGISRSELTKVAGERYWSSKTLPGEELQEDERETLGFRGEALTSLRDMALLEIVSRSQGGEETVSLVARGGERLYEGVASTPRATEGTTVWVRDIFYKWPVRRKPLSTPSARITLLNSFRHSLSTLSLLHPSVSFSLLDTSSSGTSSDSMGAKRLVNVARSTEGVLGRPGTEKVWEFERQEEQAVKGMSAEGFFSLTAAHSKGSQFLFVNSRPLAPSPLHKLINDRFSQSSFSRHAASHLVAPLSTSPSKQQASQTGTKASRKSPKKSTERFPIFVLNLVAPPGMVDVTLEPEKRVVEFEDTKRVHSFVQGIVDDFLRQQGFLSTPISRLPTTSSPTPAADCPQPQASPTRSRPSTPTTELSTKKQRLEDVAEDEGDLRVAVQRKSIDRTKELFAYPGRAASAPPSALPPQQDAPIRWTDPATHQTFFVDPRTGNSWRPDECCSRPGVEQQQPQRDSSSSERRSGGRSTIVNRSDLRRTVKDSLAQMAEDGPPEWMAQTLKAWTNPVFPSSKPGIPSLTSHKLARANSTPLSTGQPLPTSRPSRASFSSDIPSLSRSRLSTLSSFFSHPSAAANASKSAIAELPADVRGAGQRFTRENLRDAEFVAQVDRKFLLVKMRGRAELDEEEGGVEEEGQVETLVMVDQHAASERVRVEKLLEELCGKVARGEEVELWSVEPGEEVGDAAERRGCAVLVSGAEAVQAAERIEDFARWGIGLSLPSDSTCTSAPKDDDSSPPYPGDYIQIHLTSVPLIVSDRLRVEPRLQQELVRSYLAQLSEQGGGATMASKAGEGKVKLGGGEERTWRAVVRQCPPVLLDLINSKACRGAIMFNDELTPEQSRTLLARLADTSFPFQCAHGRPSLTPVVNLANPSVSSSEEHRTSSWRAGPSDGAARSSIDWGRLASRAEDDD